MTAKDCVEPITSGAWKVRENQSGIFITKVLTPCKTTQHCGLHRGGMVGLVPCLVCQPVIGPDFSQLNPGLGLLAVRPSETGKARILVWSAFATSRVELSWGQPWASRLTRLNRLVST